jgi:Fur family ferric uptake transcriptional regulator
MQRWWEHFICRTGSRIVDVACAVGDQQRLTGADDAGYAVDESQGSYRGRCPE